MKESKIDELSYINRRIFELNMSEHLTPSDYAELDRLNARKNSLLDGYSNTEPKNKEDHSLWIVDENTHSAVKIHTKESNQCVEVVLAISKYMVEGQRIQFREYKEEE